MRWFLAAFAVVSLALFIGAASAHSQPQFHRDTVWVGINGWGSVKLGEGFPYHATDSCTSEACAANHYRIHTRRVVLIQAAYKGWKFIGWHGACTSMHRTCVINVAHAHPNVYVSASFTPGPSLTTPIPMGTTAAIGEGFRVRVNSSEPNVPLLPPPPAGVQYFAANVTLSYSGGGNETPYQALGQWQAVGGVGNNNNGILHPPYSADATSCPNPGPQPPLDMLDPIQGGQSISGYVCWTIATSDANTLELFFGSGSYFDYPRTTWFALH